MAPQYMPRILVRPNSNVGRYQTGGTSTVNIQNNYGLNGNNTAGLWNGYFNRTSNMNSGIPVQMDSQYYMPQSAFGSYGGYGGYGGFSGGYSMFPSWVMRAVEGNMVFDFLKGVFGGGGTACSCPTGMNPPYSCF